jgi:hypothetical protein
LKLCLQALPRPSSFKLFLFLQTLHLPSNPSSFCKLFLFLQALPQ